MIRWLLNIFHVRVQAQHLASVRAGQDPPRFIRTVYTCRLPGAHLYVQMVGVFDTDDNRQSVYTIYLN